LVPTIRAAEPDARNKYWFSAAFADSEQAWAADSARFVFISAHMEGETGFNLTLSLHNQVVKIYIKLFFGDSLISLTLDSGYEKCTYSGVIGKRKDRRNNH